MKNKNNIIVLLITLSSISIVALSLYISNVFRIEDPAKKAIKDISSLANKLSIIEFDYQKKIINELEPNILDNKGVGKVKKNTEGKNIIFVIDSSATMEEDLSYIKQALIDISVYISENAFVSLITYNKYIKVQTNLDIFNQENKELFINQVNNITTESGSCTYDALVYALNTITLKENSIIILLDDGPITTGYTYDDLKDIIVNLDIPIYTISYNNNPQTDILKEISENTNGISTKADKNNILEKIQKILNESNRQS